MQEILQQLQQIESWERKEVQSWIIRFQKQLDEVLDVERNFYLLTLAEIQAIFLSNIREAISSLRRIRPKSQLVIFQVNLRQCYFNYLQGDYQAALKNLDIINVGRNKSSQFGKIAYDFFNRILNERKQLKGVKGKELREYQKMYIKALKSERANNIEAAKKIHIDIFYKFGKLGNSVKYEAAKHLNLLKKKKISASVDDEQEFEQAISSYEKKIENKRYYEQKVNYLMSILQIIEQPQEQDINYQLAKQYIVKSLQRQIQTVTDQTSKAKLKQLYQALKQDSVLSQQLCYKFLGDKQYQKVKESQYKGGKKIQKIKQSSIQEIKSNVPNKMKQTDSVDLGTSELDEGFSGSNMTKINTNSGGYEERYFYIKDDFKKTKKLFYCSKKGKQKDDDDYYRLKGFRKIQFGKKSKALKRSECESFEEDQCFTLLMDDEENSQRNFYVKNEKDFQNWKIIFSNLAKTVVFEGGSKIKKTIVL